MTTTSFAELTGVSKYFSGARALEGVDFSCRRGSIHAILGENGAGKSTLIKIMAGVVAADSGTLAVEGVQQQFLKPADAAKAGIVCVFQELSLMPDLTVADNISISDPPRRFGLIDRQAQRHRAEELLARIHCEDVDPRALVRDLSLSRRQMVEIAKALGKNPKLLILDEATSALTSSDVDTVYNVLAELKAAGTGMLFISHRMHEVEAICDRLSVFRNGRHIETFDKGEPEIKSNQFALEWPPGSGKIKYFEEIDKGSFFSPQDAFKKINAAQSEFILRLQTLIQHRR